MNTGSVTSQRRNKGSAETDGATRSAARVEKRTADLLSPCVLLLQFKHALMNALLAVYWEFPVVLLLGEWGGNQRFRVHSLLEAEVTTVLQVAAIANGFRTDRPWREFPFTIIARPT